MYFWESIEIDGSDVTSTHELPPAPRDHTLTFEVTDNVTGEPIEDATVEVFFVYIWNGAEIQTTEQTDATGTVTVEVVNTVVTYEVDAPGYEAESDSLDVEENRTVGVTLTRERGDPDLQLALDELYVGEGVDREDEYIELRNIGDEPIDFTGWTLEDRREEGIVGPVHTAIISCDRMLTTP